MSKMREIESRIVGFGQGNRARIRVTWEIKFDWLDRLLMGGLPKVDERTILYDRTGMTWYVYSDMKPVSASLNKQLDEIYARLMSEEKIAQ